MNSLSSQQIKLLLDQTKKVLQKIESHVIPLLVSHLSEVELKALQLKALQRFEHQLTLNELQRCFHDAEGEALTTQLTHVLSQRWNRIRQSSLCYTQKPREPVNELCLVIARAIAPPAATEDEIEALEPLTGPYCLMMPSLEVSEDVYGDNIHHLSLHEFILSDNERAYIPVKQCLYQASVSDEGIFKHIVMIDENYPDLTPSEEKRVAGHSVEAAAYYNAVMAFNRSRLFGDHLGAHLTQLARALRDGGVDRAGEELNAASAANLGILRFSAYWEQFSSRQQSLIFVETPGLKVILGRLFRPNHADYRQTNYCVQMLADGLDPIIKKYNQQSNIKRFQANVTEQENWFIRRSTSPYALLIHQNETAPSHILHRIFQLSELEQTSIFQYSQTKDALSYALAHELDALFQFELNDAVKQRTISMNLNSQGDKPLIFAAKLGRVDLLTLFLDWGANIEAYDLKGNRALYWAAHSGHLDAVNFLVARGAILDAPCENGNTAIYAAIKEGHVAVIGSLFRHGASLLVENREVIVGLELAIATRNIVVIKLVMMHLINLPIYEQKKHVYNLLGFRAVSNCPNLLCYVAQLNPDILIRRDTLLNEMMDHVLQHEEPALICQLFRESDLLGYNLLMRASTIGASQAVQKILSKNIRIDINQRSYAGETALHMAVSRGYTDIVDSLCEHGASIEARNSDGNTPLLLALMGARSDVVERLLRKNASIEVKNNVGLNAVDMAFRSYGRCLQLMLMHMATLPLTEQKRLMRDRAYDYDNVATYVLFNTFENQSFSTFNALCNMTLSDHKEKYGPEISDFLTQLHFDDHIKRMKFHYQEMHYKSLTNPRYTAAMIAAKDVLFQCLHARAVLLSSSPMSSDEKISVFKETCKAAIESGRPVLSRHREWGKVFGAFLVSLLLPISLPLYAFGVFSVKTQSARLLNNLQHDLDRLPVSAP